MNKYLADVVTATNSMNNVSAHLTTIGYSFEFREIQMIKVRTNICIAKGILHYPLYNTFTWTVQGMLDDISISTA